jgi:alkanesulfonate monooxygenase SsuD/methylene tetrahydromethanopterin reductase-like flavin-dependent oxidoreductase (luciferase family)
LIAQATATLDELTGRTLLDDGAIDYEGEFYRYRGLFTFARPVQQRVPVKLARTATTGARPGDASPRRHVRLG